MEPREIIIGLATAIAAIAVAAWAHFRGMQDKLEKAYQDHINDLRGRDDNDEEEAPRTQRPRRKRTSKS